MPLSPAEPWKPSWLATPSFGAHASSSPAATSPELTRCCVVISTCPRPWQLSPARQSLPHAALPKPPPSSVSTATRCSRHPRPSKHTAEQVTPCHRRLSRRSRCRRPGALYHHRRNKSQRLRRQVLPPTARPLLPTGRPLRC